MWPKLKIFSRVHLQMSRGESRERVVNVTGKLNVDEEYLEAFRTRSYTEIWSKVQGEIGRTDQEQLLLSHIHLSELLLEPRQQTVIDLIEEELIFWRGSGLDLHQPIYDFFNSSAEASNICGFLLQSIEKIRLNYKIIQRIIKLTQRNSGGYSDEQCQFILSELHFFTRMENPLSDSSPEKFKEIHDIFSSILKRLKSRRRKIRRKIKLIKFFKRASSVGLILACTALIAVAVILATHGFVGVLAGPIMINGSWAFLKHRFELIRKFKTSVLKRVDAELDAAEKGDYILFRDFDTISRLVRRLHDEIEHRKGIIGICLKNKERNLLREVVKEFEMNESSFLQKLEEMEKHVYLCLLTINRARRLVFQEISDQPRPS